MATNALDLSRTPTQTAFKAAGVLAFLVAAFVLHAVCWPTLPPDMEEFLFPWYRHILEAGPVGAFAEPFSNYTPTYLYLLAAASLADPLLSPFDVIKLLSVAGTGVLALSIGGLVKALGGDGRRGAFVFLLPSAAVNAAFLGQCDAYWAAGCVFALAAMVRGATLKALVWCGVAVAFKAQAAFIAPVIIGALIGRRPPLWYWAVPGLTYAALMLPAWLAGWPAADLATVYLTQARHFDVAGNLANPWFWAWVFVPDEGRPLFWMGYAAAAAAAAGLAALAAASADRRRALVSLALLSAILIPWLLPKMHERYFFLADAIAFAVALVRRDRDSWNLAVAVQLASLLALFAYVTDWRVPGLVGGLVSAAAIAAIWADARKNGAAWPPARAYSVVAPSHSSS